MRSARLLLSFTFLCLAVGALSGKTLWHQLDGYTWEDYCQEYQKTFQSPHEQQMRKELFAERLEQIKKHNQDPTKTWKEGVNQLTDRTEAELKSLLGFSSSMAASQPRSSLAVDYDSVRKPSPIAAPEEIDWRTRGVVTAVKDQGQCGSCWTFATAETIESHWALAKGNLPVLSEQQILDCTPNPDECGGTGGCYGGTAELAMDRIIQMGGLASEWTYSYASYHGANFSCRFSSNTPPAAKIKSYVVLPSNEYPPLLEAIATVGPIAISVDASTWSRYESGVFNGCNQTNPDLNHAVQLVGYGRDPHDGDYWIVRNSWSPTWGEEGYIRLKRDEHVTCGTDLHPQDGVGCKDGPPTVTVCGTCGILYDNTYPIIA